MKHRDYMNYFRKRIMLLMLVAIILSTGVTGVSYALYQQVTSSEQNEVMTVGNLRVSFEGSSVITGPMTPVDFDFWQTVEPYTFTIRNDDESGSTLPAAFTITLREDDTDDNPEGNRAPLNMLFVSINGEEPRLLSQLYDGHLTEGLLDVGAERIFDIRVWISDEADEDIIGKRIMLNIEIESIVNDNE